jgi:uncharacterized protein YndB with AHSA1/START domain
MMKIRASLQVAAAPADAFTHFTQGLDQWWPPRGRAHDAPRVFMEPHVGGRWYERDAGGREWVWGQVLAWLPPDSLLLSWQVGADGEVDPALHTEVALSFESMAAGRTRLSIEHRHLERYGAAAAEQELLFSSAVGWIGILECFARHCSSVTAAPSTQRIGAAAGKTRLKGRDA